MTPGPLVRRVRREDVEPAPTGGPVDYAPSIVGTAAVNIAYLALGLVTAAVLARTLGPDGRGAYAAILNVPMVLAIVAGFGFPNAILLEGAKRPSELGDAFLTAQVATLLLFVPVGVGCWILLPSLLVSQEASTIHSARWFLVLSVPAMGAFNLFTIAVQSTRAFQTWNLLRLGQMVLWPVLLVSAAALGHQRAGTYSLLLAASYWLMIPAGLVCLVKRSHLPWKIAPRIARRMLPYGLSAWVALLPMQLSRRLDQLALAAVVSPATLGLYVVGVTMSTIVLTFVGPAANVVAPIVASASGEEQPRIFGSFGRASVVAGVICGAGIVAVAPLVILILFGRSFAPAIVPGSILIVAATVEAIARVLGDALLALGRPSRLLRAELAGLAVMVAGLWVSLPEHPLVGTALTCLASRAAILVVTAGQISAALAMRRREFLLPTAADVREFFARAVRLVGVQGGVGRLLRKRPGPSPQS